MTGMAYAASRWLSMALTLHVCVRQLAAQQAAAARSMQYSGQGMLQGAGMPVPAPPYGFPGNMGMGAMYAQAPQQMPYGQYGAQGGMGMQQHQPGYTAPQMPYAKQPRRRLQITNPETGQEVALPAAGPPRPAPGGARQECQALGMLRWPGAVCATYHSSAVR